MPNIEAHSPRNVYRTYSINNDEDALETNPINSQSDYDVFRDNKAQGQIILWIIPG